MGLFLSISGIPFLGLKEGHLWRVHVPIVTGGFGEVVGSILFRSSLRPHTTFVLSESTRTDASGKHINITSIFMLTCWEEEYLSPTQE